MITTDFQATSSALHTSSPRRIRVLTEWQELDSLREFWASQSRHPDADLDVFSFFVRSHPEVERPFVLVLEENGRVASMLLGRFERVKIRLRLGYLKLLSVETRQLTILGDGPTGVLGRCDEQIAALLFAELLRVLKTGAANRVLLSRMPGEAAWLRLATQVPGFLQRDRAFDQSPHWSMQVPESFEAFLKKASSKRRWWMRHLLKEIDKAYTGDVKLQVFCTESEVDQFCADAEKVARKTYQRGLGVGFMNTENDRQLLQLTARLGYLRAYILYAGGQPTAFWFGVLYKQGWYSHWTGFDPEVGNHNPGTVLLLKMVEDMCRSGIKEFDFGIGPAEYKERFGDANRDETAICVYSPGLKGAALNAAVTIEFTINKWIKLALGKLGIVGRLKRYWRARLAGRGKAGGLNPGAVATNASGPVAQPEAAAVHRPAR